MLAHENTLTHKHMTSNEDVKEANTEKKTHIYKMCSLAKQTNQIDNKREKKNFLF